MQLYKHLPSLRYPETITEIFIPIRTESKDAEMTSYSPDQLSRAKKIKLLLMDVDGVMTDGKLYYFPDAQGKMVEFKGFSSHDGLGLHLCNAVGIQTGVI